MVIGRHQPDALDEPCDREKTGAVPVIRNGVQSTISAAELRQMVEDASQSGMWHADEAEDDEWYETDSPWPAWVAADGTRSYHSPYADDSAWPNSVDRRLWTELVQGWMEADDPDAVFDALMGYAETTPMSAHTVDAMERLAEVLADEPDGSAQTVCSALARRLTKMGIRVRREDGQDPSDALAEALCWAVGVDATREWVAPLPSAAGMRAAVEQWVEKVSARRDVWPSQKAAVTALVLHGASPQEARQAARAAFTARQ